MLRRQWPEVPLDEIRRRSRIVVVDDQDFPYQALFTRDGYTMEKWADVERLTDLEAGSYDLILLDLQGVGAMESKEQGLGVLKHIRETHPAQIIIAYSNADWSLRHQPFFDMADAVLHKSADYFEFKREVDRLLQERFSLGFYLSRIESELASHEELAPRIRRRARSAILSRRPDRLGDYLRRRIDDERAVERVLEIARVATGVIQIWTS